MPVAPSAILDFIEQQATVVIERHELASTAFGSLRRNLREIIVRLGDSDTQDGCDISERLRRLVSVWLTVPVPFGSSMRRAVEELLGAADGVQSRWGSDVRVLYESALRAAADLPAENPVREVIRAAIREQRSLGQTVGVFCSRRARADFESIAAQVEGPPLVAIDFLHSVRDYREAAPFDVMMKVGPLRARGWDSVPDALLTAPRFRKLLQIVWSGCRDEEDFGYDPVSPPTNSRGACGSTAATNADVRRGRITLTTRVISSGQDTSVLPGDAAQLDELRLFQEREMSKGRESRPATLVQVDGGRGILYPPHSLVLCFDPDPTLGEPVDRRRPSALVEGVYVIIPLADDIDLGGVRAGHGRYSQMWKSLLERESRADLPGLIARLRAAGLDLQDVRSAVQHWCEPPSTVIHAPKEMRHFEILWRVLRADGDWRPAWDEVRRSRGEAIQYGVQSQEIAEEQLLTILRTLEPTIREGTMAAGNFRLEIPPDTGITGAVSVLRVSGIEEGFSVPEPELRVVHELSRCYEWRD